MKPVSRLVDGAEVDALARDAGALLRAARPDVPLTLAERQAISERLAAARAGRRGWRRSHAWVLLLGAVGGAAAMLAIVWVSSRGLPARPAPAPAAVVAAAPVEHTVGACVVETEQQAGSELVVMGPAVVARSGDEAIALRSGRLLTRVGLTPLVVRARGLEVSGQPGAVFELRAEATHFIVAAHEGEAHLTAERVGRTIRIEAGTAVELRPDGSLSTRAATPLMVLPRAGDSLTTAVKAQLSCAVDGHWASPAAASVVSIPADVPVEEASVAAETPKAPPPRAPSAVAEPAAAAPPPAIAAESRLLTEALHALRRNHDGRAALVALDEYVRRFPEGMLAPEATLARLDALLALKRRDDALRLLSAIPVHTHVRARELRVIRGELLAEARRCGDAVADFSASLVGDESSLEERALYGRASCGIALGQADPRRRDLARRDLADYLRRFPRGPHAAAVRAALQ